MGLARIVAASARTGNVYSWLLYPIGVLVLSFVVGSMFVTEGSSHALSDDALEAVIPATQ